MSEVTANLVIRRFDPVSDAEALRECLILHRVLARNDQARAFYATHGFREHALALTKAIE